jgi:hypothetical protein
MLDIGAIMMSRATAASSKSRFVAASIALGRFQVTVLE